MNLQPFITMVSKFERERTPGTFLTDEPQTVYRLSSRVPSGITICEPRNLPQRYFPDIVSVSFTEYWQFKDPAKPANVKRCMDSSEDQHCSRSMSAWLQCHSNAVWTTDVCSQFPLESI